MKAKKCFVSIWLLAAVFMFSGCDKFLDAKPEVNLSTPETMEDLRALLDNENRINRNYPGLMEMGADDYYLEYNAWASRPAFDQDVYVWADEPLSLLINTNQQWTSIYNNISTVNVVMEALERLSSSGAEEARQITGEALFVRGLMHFYISQLYAPAYDPSNADLIDGIPLKLSSSVEEVTVRASLQETYKQIVEDLSRAAELLHVHSEHLTRPTALAAHAALARVYLVMGDYDRALQASDYVLQRYNLLLDYNTVNVHAANPFPWQTNPELLYFAVSTSGSSLLASSRANVDTLLYQSFSEDDLRKLAFFEQRSGGVHSFKGFYMGLQGTYFAGFATDELYLNKAECLIRKGNIQEGLATLNHLLSHRWRSGTFTPLTTSSPEEALVMVLEERRKQLQRRGVRWSDLKRLNREPGRAIEIVRRFEINGSTVEYRLPPNDLRYVYLIPQLAVEMTGMPQNKR